MPQILSVSWLFDVHRMMGMRRVSGSRLIARVGQDSFDTRGLFETDLPALQHALAPSAFVF